MCFYPQTDRLTTDGSPVNIQSKKSLVWSDEPDNSDIFLFSSEQDDYFHVIHLSINFVLSI